MKIFIFLIFICGTFECFANELSLSKKVFKNQNFIPKMGNEKYGSYLQMNIDFKSIQSLFFKLDKKLKGSLSKENARVEAHITVITPIEYREVLEPAGLNINDINIIAVESNIQNSNFSIDCLGMGETKDKTNQTYYLVVKSQTLLDIRKKIFKAYIKKGGIPSQFDPTAFYPHITVGYTTRDLHLTGDGVLKGNNSCWRDIKLL